MDMEVRRKIMRNILFVLLCLLLLTITSCGKPKYKVDTCFEIGFTIVQITKVDSDYYYVKIHSLITGEKRIKHNIFEKQIEEDGMIPKSCDEYRTKEN